LVELISNFAVALGVVVPIPTFCALTKTMKIKKERRSNMPFFMIDFYVGVANIEATFE
jgi:hypothetical protein